MKNDMMGLIFGENPEASMGELTSKRPLSAIPFGGRYRIIDFILSNMVNSSIINVGIVTPYDFRSLSDHLGTGKDWDIDRKGNGLFFLPPIDVGDNGEIRGGIDLIQGHLHYLSRSRQSYVLVTDCVSLCNINFSDVLKQHLEQESDITLIYTEDDTSKKNLSNSIFLETSEEGRVTDIHVHPVQLPKSNKSYMHMFLIKKDLLIDLVADASAHNKHHLSRDIFLPNIERLKIDGYKYKGYCRQIDNIKAFFNANLDLLKKPVREELFGLKTEMPVYTKVKDTVPTKYASTAEVSNSFIADGCIIEGTVKNSIIFRGVHIGKGAVVENCILMQTSQVMDNCLLENVIFDKEVVLRSGKKLVGQDTYPMVIGKKTVI